MHHDDSYSLNDDIDYNPLTKQAQSSHIPSYYQIDTSAIYKSWIFYGVVLLLVFAVVLSILLGSTLIVVLVRQSSPIISKPKNIIFMVGDGFGPASQTFARVASGNGSLALDDYFVGTSRTYSSDSTVTDSAAGATAFACGLKSYNGAIGVDPQGKPCGTILEAALQKGMKTGLISTTFLSDATPASFSAHAGLRSSVQEIAKQQIVDLTNFVVGDKKYALDVMLGGGRCYIAGKAQSDFTSCRTDDFEGIKESKALGYNFISNREDLLKVDSLPIMGLFADKKMRYNIDRTENDPEPTLLEMVKKGIGLLSKSNPDGFFLVIEGARIDHAGHSNDISAQVREVFHYNEVFKYVSEWANENKETLVVSTADHETGGLTLGRAVDGVSLYTFNYTVALNVNKSTEVMATDIMSKLNQGSSFNDTVKSVLISNGLSSPISDFEVYIAQSTQDVRSNVTALMLGLGEIINRRVRVGFSTVAHTGVDVNVYSAGVQSEKFKGNQENTALGNKIAAMMDFDLKAITEKLNE
ncbi:alkaline phosphatase [Acrasis kona]|uniref:Alkaline phosphatase n=1 Tax=Acrasis kona TaxID=1008807 RepID=A0AAW2ZJQ9_9EUKA